MRSRHKRTNNEHGHFTIINYMQKKQTQKRDNSLNMGTFINEVCISCLQLLKTLYVYIRMSLVLGKLICNMHSCMFVLDFGKNQKSFPTCLLIYT